jgi:hypothetical protein
VSLRDLFIDAFGEPLLVPGAAIDLDQRLYEPHRATFDEVIAVLGAGRRRETLLVHLGGLLSWLDRAGGGAHRVWLRGELAATLRPEPLALDVLVLLAPPGLADGDQWIAQVLATRPRLTPIELVFDVIPEGDEDEVMVERRRSAVRCHDVEGDQIVTGWIEVRRRRANESIDDRGFGRRSATPNRIPAGGDHRR